MEHLFKDFGKVFIRTPVYSYSSLFNEHNETKNLDELVRLRVNDPVFLEALYWSSPQVLEAVLKFKEGGVKGAKEKKLMTTLKKYLIRASTRCTPYGIYAGTGIANIGTEQEDQKPEMERKVRIDMGLLQTIKSAIESDPAVYPHLFYSLNNSLYPIPGQYRFMETIIDKGACHYQLSSLEHSDFLEEIILLSKDKMLSVEDIYSLTEKDTPKEEFNNFINELIKSQFLVSELQIGLTGGDEVEKFIGVLKRVTEKGVKHAEKYLRLFLSIQAILSQFEKLEIGDLPFEEINHLKSLLDECGIPPTDHLFHADLRLSIPGVVFSKEKLKEISKAIIALGKLSSTPSPHDIEIECFKKLFIEKYQTREIPLSEALDPEFGIGFPAKDCIGNVGFNPLLENLASENEYDQKQYTQNCEGWLRDKREALTSFHFNESIEIKEEDLKDLPDKSGDLPFTFSVMGNLLPGGKILLESIGGTHANSLPGRFAYLDNEMMDVCKEVSDAEKEAYNHIIFAEIIFTPEGRIGNIARRPVLSDYEIPLLTNGATEEKQIPVNDLMVSIKDNEVILRSKKLGQRIIPRLSNAHNYTRSLVPAYRFLCSIQQQGKRGFSIRQEDAASKRFQPRIIYKNFIFHRACWFLYKSDIKAIVESDDPLTELRNYFLRWNVTRFVCFTEADNELLTDTHNEIYLKLLLEEIKCRTRVKLVEWLYNTDFDAPVQQFILPLSQTKTSAFKQVSNPEDTKNITRSFVPGSEWVYFKIYSGSSVSDKILMNVVKPAIDMLLDKCMIKEAFFIRYTDPHYHIRFRLHLEDRHDMEPLAFVLKCVYQLLHPFSENGLVWKVQLDTYEREIERYGESEIPATEAIFFHDSLLFLNCMQHEEFAENAQIRLLAALKNINKWLSLFEMSIVEKADYCKRVMCCFSSECKPEIKLQADVKYRELKNLLPAFLNSDKFDKEFRIRDEKIQDLLCMENLASYIHMSLNRWFVNQQRLMEYMCYSFIYKYYRQLLHTNNNSLTALE